MAMMGYLLNLKILLAVAICLDPIKSFSTEPTEQIISVVQWHYIDFVLDTLNNKSMISDKNKSRSHIKTFVKGVLNQAHTLVDDLREGPQEFSLTTKSKFADRYKDLWHVEMDEFSSEVYDKREQQRVRAIAHLLYKNYEFIDYDLDKIVSYPGLLSAGNGEAKYFYPPESKIERWNEFCNHLPGLFDYFKLATKLNMMSEGFSGSIHSYVESKLIREAQGDLTSDSEEQAQIIEMSSILESSLADLSSKAPFNSNSNDFDSMRVKEEMKACRKNSNLDRDRFLKSYCRSKGFFHRQYCLILNNKKAVKKTASTN